MKDMSWEYALEVTADGNGVAGHGGRDDAAQARWPGGLTAELDGALAQRGASPQVSRGAAVISTAVAITMGATSMPQDLNGHEDQKQAAVGQ